MSELKTTADLRAEYRKLLEVKHGPVVDLLDDIDTLLAHASSPDPAREALVGALKDIAEWWETDAPNRIDFPRGKLYAAIALAEQGHKGAAK